MVQLDECLDYLELTALDTPGLFIKKVDRKTVDKLAAYFEYEVRARDELWNSYPGTCVLYVCCRFVLHVRVCVSHACVICGL